MVASGFLVPFPAQPLAVELAAVATVLGLLGLCCVLAVLAAVLAAARIKVVAIPRSPEWLQEQTEGSSHTLAAIRAAVLRSALTARAREWPRVSWSPV